MLLWLQILTSTRLFFLVFDVIFLNMLFSTFKLLESVTKGINADLSPWKSELFLYGLVQELSVLPLWSCENGGFRL